jgi:F-box protein 9
MEDPNPELENFRNQWRKEVSARTKGTAKESEKKQSRPSVPTRASFKNAKDPIPPPSAANTSAAHNEDDVDGLDPKTYHDLEDTDNRRRLDSNQYPSSSVDANTTPISALEHYEKAVEKESQGSLGDSLSLYRKAYRVCVHDCTSESNCI